MNIFVLLVVCGFQTPQPLENGATVISEVSVFKDAKECLKLAETIQREPELVNRCSQLMVSCKERPVK